MEFSELVKTRKSCRNFNTKSISKDVLLSILEDARLCQSAMNRQPWEIKILKGEEKNKIADILDLDHEEALSRNASFIRDCNILLLIYTEQENENNVSNLISIGAMIEHICLSAYDHNIGALWNRYMTKKSDLINKELNIKNKFLVSGVLLGYYDGELPSRPRKSLDEILIK